MTYTFVLEDDRLLVRARENGLKAIKKPALDELVTDLEGVIIVMADNEAQKIAQELADRGRDETMVEWIDGSEYEGGVDALLDAGIELIALESRDLYFEEIRSLKHAEADASMQDRITVGPDWAERNIILRRRELIVVVGPYGCGKSTLLQYIGIHWCLGQGARYEEGHPKVGQIREKPVWFCTWEDDPMEQKDQILRFFTKGRCQEADAAQLAEADQICDMILHTRPEKDLDRNFEWYSNRGRCSTLAGNGDHMVVYFDKVKIERDMGKAREVIALTYDPNRHELYQDLDATMDAAAAWGCAAGGKKNGERPKKKK